MSTIANALTFARAQAQTDSNGLTDTNGLIFANEALLDFRRRLVNAGVDAAQTQEAYTDITANVGTYLYPTDMLWLKAIEVNYTDTTQQNYITANQLDVSNTPNLTSFSYLRQNQPTSAPQFDDRGDWFEIFPTPTVSNTSGIRIFYFLEPTEFTSTADTISYPESLDYRILGYRIAANYKRSLLDFISAAAFDQEYDHRVTQLIGTLGRGVQTPIQATVIQDTGWEY